jgi:hypothetical protein
LGGINRKREAKIDVFNLSSPVLTIIVNGDPEVAAGYIVLEDLLGSAQALLHTLFASCVQSASSFGNLERQSMA